MPGLLGGENIKEIDGLTNSFRVIVAGMVRYSVRRMQVSVCGPHTTIQARRNTERLPECPRERFQRSVICVETDVCHGELGTRQLPCRSFQQQPAAHGDRRLLGDCPEHSIKLRPASISVAGKVL